MRARRRGSTPTARIVLLEDQDRGLWNRDDDRRRAWRWSTRRCATGGPAPTRCRPRSPRCTPGPPGPRTPTGRRSICSTRRSSVCSRRPSSPSTARSRSPRSRGPAAALAMIEPLAEPLVRLLPLLRPEGRAAPAARPRRGGPRRLRPGDRARQHGGGSRPHPAASRPADEGQQARAGAPPRSASFCRQAKKSRHRCRTKTARPRPSGKPLEATGLSRREDAHDQIVSRDEWLAARKAHLATRRR